MKTFNQFIKEDFNSNGAQQFLITVSEIIKGSKKASSSARTVMVFYEHVTKPSFNLVKYSKSFLSPNVAEIMKSNSNDYRILVYHSSNGFHIFVWDARIQHNQMTISLDDNKNMKKYPSDIKYSYLYRECQIFMDGDEIGENWCFPFVIFENSFYLNLNKDALMVLNKAKDLKSIFQFSDQQFGNLSKKQDFDLI